MSHLSEVYIKTDILKILSDTVIKKGDKGISITISTDDQQNQFGQNISAYVSQSKEDQEAKKNRFYIGNGKVFWANDGTPFVPKKEPAHTPKKEYSSNDSEEGLPF